jgi:hypothetical protein
MMIEYEPRTIGNLYAISVNGTILAHKNGEPRTYKSHKKAFKASQSLGNGAHVVSVMLTVPEALQPVKIDSSTVAEVLREIANQYDTGHPRIAICDLRSDVYVRTLRHTPLGEKPVIEKGDRDMVYELHLKWYCDVATVRDKE